MNTNKALSEKERAKIIEEMIFQYIGAAFDLLEDALDMLELRQGLISQGSDKGQGSGGFNRAPSGGR